MKKGMLFSEGVSPNSSASLLEKVSLMSLPGSKILLQPHAAETGDRINFLLFDLWDQMKKKNSFARKFIVIMF